MESCSIVEYPHLKFDVQFLGVFGVLEVDGATVDGDGVFELPDSKASAVTVRGCSFASGEGGRSGVAWLLTQVSSQAFPGLIPGCIEVDCIEADLCK